MKKNELTFGSLVALKGNEAEKIVVNGITRKKIQCITEKKQPKYYRHSQIVPIELSEFILQDLGFEKRHLTLLNSSKSNLDDYVLVIYDKKDQNVFFIISIQGDEGLGSDKCRAVHIDNNRYETEGFGYVRNVHELQGLIHLVTKLQLDTSKLLCKD